MIPLSSPTLPADPRLPPGQGQGAARRCGARPSLRSGAAGGGDVPGAALRSGTGGPDPRGKGSFPSARESPGEGESGGETPRPFVPGWARGKRGRARAGCAPCRARVLGPGGVRTALPIPLAAPCAGEDPARGCRAASPP